MATVKIPESLARVVFDVLADVVSSVVKQLVEEKTGLKQVKPSSGSSMGFHSGQRIRIRLIPR